MDLNLGPLVSEATVLSTVLKTVPNGDKVWFGKSEVKYSWFCKVRGIAEKKERPKGQLLKNI